MASKLFLVFPLLVSSAFAQEVRASLTGLVTDPSGAPVAGATITVTNIAQNVSVSTATNETGMYVTPYLSPGTYRLTVEQAGFKRLVRENIVLEAMDKVRLDVSLEIGQLAESVTVRESVSMLQTESASRSQIIANELIAQVPTQGRNPFQIAWAAAGVIKAGDWRYLRSFDIGGTSGFSVNGGRNKENEVLLDGISDVQADRTVIHVPTMDSVQEFKVLTNTYDAQYGRTGGGIVTIVTKSGGNDFHGSLFEFLQNHNLNANTSELNRGGKPRPPFHINQFGAQASGPIYVPKVFDGRNRLFWMLSYEGMRQRTGDPDTKTFPTTEIRGGDFSSLYNAQGQPVLIYDPLTTSVPDGARKPFPGNLIPADRISPIAREVMKYYPPPSAAGDGPAHVNNYPYRSRWECGFDQWIGRADFMINAKNNFFFRYGQNPFKEFRALVWPTPNVAEPTGNAPLIRNGRNWTFDWTSTISPRMTFNLRAGLNRWEETTGNVYGANYDPRKLGFDPNLVAQFTKLQFPRFDLGSYQAVGTDRLLNYNTDDTYSVQPNAGLVVAKHYMKFGFEGRQYKDNKANPGLASGRYGFGKNWTQANALRGDAVSGNELATFLLGYPSSASVDRNIDPTFLHRYYALFLNDDWKISSRLTLNLGLRWDYEAPNYERYNRMIRGFDWNAASPIASQVKGLNLKGAVLFAANGQPRYIFEPDKNNLQPRVGVAYRIGQKYVVRAGYGLYYLGQNEAGSTQGFSRTTSAVVSTDGGFTPAVALANPFSNLPGGRLLDPIGNTLGAASFLGESVPGNYFQRPLPYSHQYSVDIQRELPSNVLVEVGYVGNLTRKLPLGPSLNYLPASEMARRTSAGAIDTAYYKERLTNPMAGLIPNNPALNGATIPRENLLVAFPQYSGVGLSSVPIGSQRYHGFQSKVTKRYSRGLTFLASYTVMKNLEQASLLNAQDFVLANPEQTRLEKRSAGQVDIPQKFTIAGVFDLPFGKGRTYGAAWVPALDAVLGGWSLNWDVTYQRGWVVGYPNAKQVRPGSAKLDSPTLLQWFNASLWDDPATGKRVSPQEPYTLRDYPTLFGDVRLPGYRNWDASISKYFRITERAKMQFRFEMINAFNHPWFPVIASVNVTDARFAQLEPTQRNLPRNIKLVLNLSW